MYGGDVLFPLSTVQGSLSENSVGLEGKILLKTMSESEHNKANVFTKHRTETNLLLTI